MSSANIVRLNCKLQQTSPQWNQPWRGEGAYLTKSFQPVRQQGGLFGAMLLRSSKANASSLCLLQGLNSKWDNLD